MYTTVRSYRLDCSVSSDIVQSLYRNINDVLALRAAEMDHSWAKLP